MALMKHPRMSASDVRLSNDMTFFQNSKAGYQTFVNNLQL